MTKAEFFKQRAVADFLKHHGVKQCRPGSAVPPGPTLSVRLGRRSGAGTTALIWKKIRDEKGLQ